MSDLSAILDADLSSGNEPGLGPLRIGGMTISHTPESTANLPSTRSRCSAEQMPALTMVRDLIAGPERVRACGSTYLPRSPGELPEDFADRLARSVFFNVVGRTKHGLVGQVFRKDPVVGNDVPQVIRQHLENIDLAGTHFDIFTRKLLDEAIEAGHTAILVDFPTTDGRQSFGDELTAIRPYWVPIRKENILSWRTETINGRVVLTQLVLRECVTVPLGAFGEQEEERYRVLYNRDGVVGWALLSITDDKQVIKLAEGTYPTQTEIPVAEVQTSGSEELFESTPPLLDLAYLNVAHYQLWSDTATARHKTCVPIFFGAGFTEETDQNGNKRPLILGPNTAITTSNPDAKAEYVSHSGASLDNCQKGLDDLKADMGTLGLSMLAPQKRSAETLGAKRLDKNTEDSALAVTARGLQDALERALEFHAKYLRLPDGGSVVINREFDEQEMAADLLTAYVGAVANAGLPPRILLETMQRYGALPPDADLDAIEAEMLARDAAMTVQRQQAQQDALALSSSSGASA